MFQDPADEDDGAEEDDDQFGALLSEGVEDDEELKTDTKRAHIGTFVGTAYWQSPEMV